MSYSFSRYHSYFCFLVLVLFALCRYSLLLVHLYASYLSLFDVVSFFFVPLLSNFAFSLLYLLFIMFPYLAYLPYSDFVAVLLCTREVIVRSLFLARLIFLLLIIFLLLDFSCCHLPLLSFYIFQYKFITLYLRVTQLTCLLSLLLLFSLLPSSIHFLLSLVSPRFPFHCFYLVAFLASYRLVSTLIISAFSLSL